jgi:MinD-like ATPase involved in chromosome partitioning or flagellar assembly
LARNIGIISVKGGVGKTSLTTTLGAALAKEYNKKVLLVDANFSAPNLALHLGLTDPDVTIHHVLSDKVDIQHAIYESEHGFHLIPGSMVYGEVNPFKLRSKLKSLQKYYDAIIIDSSPALNSEIMAAIIASDEIYMITTPDKVTLNTTLRIADMAKQKSIPIKGLIVNKIHNKNFELGIGEIERLSGCKVLAMLPHEIAVLDSLSKMDPLSPSKNIQFSKEIKRLAGVIISAEQKHGFLDKAMDFFHLTSRQEMNRRMLFEENREV